ncbi:MAG: nuclear transport factor 2 family protein [Rhodanobacteraceae bacterium]
MRRSFAAVLILMLGVAPAAVFAVPAPPKVAGEIVSIAQRLMDAVGTGDKAIWRNTMTDDAVVIDEFGRVQSGKEMVDSLRALPQGFSGSIEVRNPQVNLYGDTAVLQAEAYERESVFEQKLVVRYIMTCTFVKRADAWKLVAYADVTLPTAPPKLDVPGLDPRDYAGIYRYGPGRAWTFSVERGVLGYVTKQGRPFQPVEPIAKDVFMGSDDERNLLVFRRDHLGQVDELIERRKFNDLHLARERAPAGQSP